MNFVSSLLSSLSDPGIVQALTNTQVRARIKYLLDISLFNLTSLNISQFVNDSNYTSCLYTQIASVAVSNTVTETSLLASTTTLPANFFIVGKQIVFRLRGFHSTTANPTIRIRVYLNSTVVMDTGIRSSGNGNNDYWDLEGVLNCRSVGATGAVMG